MTKRKTSLDYGFSFYDLITYVLNYKFRGTLVTMKLLTIAFGSATQYSLAAFLSYLKLM